MDHSSTRSKMRKERAQLSCAFCRHRKLKCDRNQPCDQCIKRKQPCHFNTPAAARVSKPQQDGQSSTIQNRIQHLEGLVLSLMNHDSSGTSISDRSTSTSPNRNRESSATSGESPSCSATSPDAEVPLKSFGLMNVSEHQTKYVGHEHWRAILHDIEEVKTAVLEGQADGESTDTPESDSTYKGPDILAGMPGPFSKADMLSTLPSKLVMDSLVSEYLNSADPFTIMIHLPTFKLEYNRFWQDQYSAPLPWISLIYSMMAMTAHTRLRAMGTTPELEEELRGRFDLYRRQAAKCLVLSEYSNPRRYTLEALTIYLGIEWLRLPEMEAGLWAVFGMVVRLATAMGYHRDPSHFPKISIFHGEMRRRLWAGLVQLDVLTSNQVGLPRMIRDSTADSKLPSNCHDSDLSENMTELPPSRPASEYTKMSYAVIKTRLIRVLGMITDELDEIQSSPYEEILRLDKLLLEAEATMPDYLRLNTPLASLAESPGVIMRRMNLQTVYLKSRCILHRQYLTAYRTNPQYAFSREAAVSAATQLLRNQILLDGEIRVGGRLSHDRWLLSSLTTGDFTLAAMIVCLDLDSRTSGDSVVVCDSSDDELFDLLEKCSTIWKDWSKKEISAPKAKIASDALATMLAKVQRVKAAAQARSSGSLESSYPSLMPWPQSSGAPSLSPQTTQSSQQSSSYSPPESELGALNTWIEAPQSMEWTQWDELFMTFNYTTPESAEPQDGVWSFPPGLEHSDVFDEPITNESFPVVL